MEIIKFIEELRLLLAWGEESSDSRAVVDGLIGGEEV
jgi:hypothetical protein